MMPLPQPLIRARWLALLVPAALLGGAWGSQLIGGLAPCEMCHWQRWPHYAALAPAVGAFMATRVGVVRLMVAIAAVLIAVSGLIGAFHAGVEYGWWEGLTTCALSGPMTLDSILDAPLIRCDVAPWDLFGISLAGFNALFSIGGALVIALLLRRSGSIRA